MNNFGAPGRQEAGDTNPLLGLSVQGSTFGDYARVSQQNFQLQNGTFLLQPSEHFLKHLSNIDPRVEKKTIDAAVKIKSTNLSALQKLLDQGSEVDRWIRGDSGQFLFVNDSTGRAHTILASKIVDKVETLHVKEYLATSYFFRRSESSKGLSFTASDIVAGLARVCLTDRRLGPRLVSEIQGTYGSSIVASDLEVTAGILMEILKLLHEQSSEQGIMFVVDGIQNCTTDAGQNGLDELAIFLKNLAQSYPKSKWLISGRLLGTVEKGLRRLCDTPASICLDSVQVAAIFDLDVVVETMTALARNIHASQTQRRSKRLQDSQDDLSWVQYCHAARTWLTQSHDKPRILGYRRSSQEPLQPSSLGWHFAMGAFEGIVPSRLLRVYFSFADSFLPDVDNASVVRSHSLHPSQAVWCLFTQLAILHCEDDADLASLILSFPEEAQQALKFVYSIIENHKRSSNVHRAPDVWPVVSWYQELLCLELKRMATFTKALIDHLKSNGIEVLLIVDCLELVNSAHGAEFTLFLDSLECSFRALLCFNDEDKRECASWNGWGQYLPHETVIHEKTEYHECMRGLRFKDMHQRREQVSDPMHETNEWLWTNTTFQNWERDGGLLWISGKPGSGKSVLAKSILRRFSSSAVEAMEQTPWLTCGWFYTARSSDIGTRHDFMMRSILYEMLESAASVFDDVKPLYRKYLDGIDGAVEWTYNKLEAILDAVRVSPRMPATVAVIDALDESENSEVGWERALRILQRLGKDSSIRLVMLSRPESRILDILSRSPFINLQQHNSNDISILIEDGICRLREAWPLSSDLDYENDETCSSADEVSVVSEESRSSIGPAIGRHTDTKNTERFQREQMLDEIRHYLKRDASGVILWVTLVLYQLQIDIEGTCGFTPRQLRDTLKSLPTEIEQLYSYSLKKLRVLDDPTKLRVTKDILTWIVGSKGWSALELRELRDALAISEIGLDHQELYSLKHSRRLFGGNWSIFCLYIQDHCGPLVEILDNHQSPITMQHKRKERHRGHVAQPTWTIQLLHQTVNSFLRKNNGHGPLRVERKEAEHYVITKSYLYLGMPTSSKTLFNPPQSNSQSRPLNVLDNITAVKMRSEIPQELPQDLPQELLAVTHCCKEWPLAKFALTVLWQTQPTVASISERLSRIDHHPVSLTEDRLHFPLYWAADMCFVPPHIQDSSIENLVKSCCLTGNADALRLMFKLMGSYKHRYESLQPRQYLMSGHDRQMIQGAIQAINYLEDEGTLCHHHIKRALHKLNERLLQQESAETASNQKTLGKSCSSDVQTSSEKSTSSDRSTSPHKVMPRKRRKLGVWQSKTTGLQFNESNVLPSI